jgi:hypothetical protein
MKSAWAALLFPAQRLDPNIYEYTSFLPFACASNGRPFSGRKMTAMVGYSINYAIDLQTNGGAFQTVITSVAGKRPAVTSAAIINCQPVPQRGRFACAKLRQMQTAQKSATLMLQSYTEVIDAKLRYPNTHCSISSSTPASLMAQYRRFPASRAVALSASLIPTILKHAPTAVHGQARFGGRGR